jgi:hypothetical protein
VFRRGGPGLRRGLYGSWLGKLHRKTSKGVEVA